jgi:hypothetical protein
VTTVPALGCHGIQRILAGLPSQPVHCSVHRGYCGRHPGGAVRGADDRASPAQWGPREWH